MPNSTEKELVVDRSERYLFSIPHLYRDCTLIQKQEFTCRDPALCHASFFVLYRLAFDTPEDITSKTILSLCLRPLERADTRTETSSVEEVLPMEFVSR